MTDDLDNPLNRTPNPHPEALRPDPDRQVGDPPFPKMQYCTRCCMPETSHRF